MSTNENETRARALGWRPKEQFRGKPEHWVDADTFVRRGEEIMPILKENNAQLERKLVEQGTELAAAQALIAESQTEIRELAKFNSEVMRDRAKVKKGELLDALKVAKKEGDVDAEVQLTDQLTEHNAALAKAEAAPTVEEKPKPAAATETPEIARAKAEFTQWAKDHDWYNTDPVKTGAANGIAAKLRAEGSKLIGREFYDEVAAQTEELFGGNPRRIAPGKTEAGGRGTGSGGGGSPATKGYSDLDADAQAACERFTKTLVGPGKSYKTVEDWRKAYAADYFSRA